MAVSACLTFAPSLVTSVKGKEENHPECDPVFPNKDRTEPLPAKQSAKLLLIWLQRVAFFLGGGGGIKVMGVGGPELSVSLLRDESASETV